MIFFVDKHRRRTCRLRQLLWPSQETVARYIYLAMRKLPHNLRIERRQAGLSQADMAALFGVRSMAKLSRYENLRRLPGLTTALGYEAILGKPVAELFAGTYGRIRADVLRRARRLGKTLQPHAGPARRKGATQSTFD
jgi:transcriptional regulator with XRE-family HTH domain